MHSRPRRRAMPRTMWRAFSANWGVGVNRLANCAKKSVRQVVADPRYRKVVPGAFLSPWFAVSLGIVVAASMTLAEPHAALSFPSDRGEAGGPGGYGGYGGYGGSCGP